MSCSVRNKGLVVCWLVCSGMLQDSLQKSQYPGICTYVLCLGERFRCQSSKPLVEVNIDYKGASCVEAQRQSCCDAPYRATHAVLGGTPSPFALDLISGPTFYVECADG